jgi:hypothetical protein
MEKLKPCPFCGNEITKEDFTSRSFDYDNHGCPDTYTDIVVDCCIGFHFCVETVEEAIETWNKRIVAS